VTVKYVVTIEVDQRLPPDGQERMRQLIEEKLDYLMGQLEFGVEFTVEEIDPRKGLTDRNG
jgi:hypothetical protein